MSLEPLVRVEHIQIKEQTLKVTLTRGAKGVYRWEITCYAPDVDTAVEVLIEADTNLAYHFGEAEMEVCIGH